LLELDESLILVNIEAQDAETVITMLAERLHEHGAVDSNYGPATIEREKEHPTGLPTKPFCIAFPHADAYGVRRSSLAVASLSEPVIFKNMADPDEDLPVELVFLLANNNPEEQVEALRSLAEVFGQQDKLIALRSLTKPTEIVQWLKHELN
jgi:PTS system galactitol-specific IIA component